MKPTTRTMLRRLALIIPLLALFAGVAVLFQMPTVETPPKVERSRGIKNTGDAPQTPSTAMGAAPPLATAALARTANVPSRLPLPAPASLDSTKPQPGHFAGVTVINAPAPPPEIPPSGTPRTPLVWKSITTNSGKRLLVAKPDATWQVPFTAKNAGR